MAFKIKGAKKWDVHELGVNVIYKNIHIHQKKIVGFRAFGIWAFDDMRDAWKYVT